jgi:hypothetical protein
MGRGGTRPAARRGGGREGVLAFPARGRRTRATKARKAPGRGNGAIPVPKLAEDVAEEAC